MTQRQQTQETVKVDAQTLPWNLSHNAMRSETAGASTTTQRLVTPRNAAPGAEGAVTAEAVDDDWWSDAPEHQGGGVCILIA